MGSIRLSIMISDLKKPPARFEAKYPALFAQVESKSDIPFLILLCEILGIVDRDGHPVFSASIYTDSDMFGGRSQYWSIKTKNITLTRAIEKEINESWQSVTEIEDSLSIVGMPEGTFLDWDGNMGYDNPMVVGNIDAEQADRMIVVAGNLYGKVTAEKSESDPKDRIRSDLKRQYKLKDQATVETAPDSVGTYGPLLLDENDDVAKGAIENLKSFMKETEGIEAVKMHLLSGMEKAGKYVRHDIVEAVGFSFNPALAEVVIAGLVDPDNYVKEAACRWAPHFFRASTVPLLFKNCRSEEDNLRWAAVAALGKIMDEDDADAKEKKAIAKDLTPFLNDQNRYVRSAAVSILSDRKDPKLYGRFVKLLKDTTPDIRETAIYALGRLKNPKALSPLKTLLVNEAERTVIDAAKKAIAKLRSIKSTEAATASRRTKRRSNPSRT